jgi:hypothetical protein
MLEAAPPLALAHRLAMGEELEEDGLIGRPGPTPVRVGERRPHQRRDSRRARPPLGAAQNPQVSHRAFARPR